MVSAPRKPRRCIHEQQLTIGYVRADVDEYIGGSGGLVTIGAVGPDGCGCKTYTQADRSVIVTEKKDGAGNVIPGFLVVDDGPTNELMNESVDDCEGKVPFTADGSNQLT